MSAPISHAGLTIPGTNQGLIFGTPESKRTKNEIFSLKGATVLDGESGTREITCEHILHNNYSNLAQLNTFLVALKEHRAAKGTLTDSLGQTFQEVEFIRQEPVEGPLYFAYVGWWKKIRLIFEELQP